MYLSFCFSKRRFFIIKSKYKNRGINNELQKGNC